MVDVDQRQKVSLLPKDVAIISSAFKHTASEEDREEEIDDVKDGSLSEFGYKQQLLRWAALQHCAN